MIARVGTGYGVNVGVAGNQTTVGVGVFVGGKGVSVGRGGNGVGAGKQAAKAASSITNRNPRTRIVLLLFMVFGTFPGFLALEE